MEESTCITHLFWRLTDYAAIAECKEEAEIEPGDTCYDYIKRGPVVNDTCKYNYMSILCEKLGEIRYPAAYRYW